MADEQPIPVVMVFAGCDATGGAGIQADIETLASMGCHAAPVITATTVQDTQGLQGYLAIDAVQVIAQARAVLEDMPVAAFKIGMLGSVANVEAVHTLLQDYPDTPVVLDPVITAGGGGELADAEVVEAMVTLLFPLTTVLAPNSLEARGCAPEGAAMNACGQERQQYG